MSGLAHWLSGPLTPWAELYGASIPLSIAVAFLHFGGLLAAGGFALAFDRAALLRVRPEPGLRSAFVGELAAIHRPVLIGLVVVTVSGMAMLAADVEALLPSPVFWLKMGAFVLLLANGVYLRRMERRLAADPDDEHGWRRLRAGATASTGLWFLVLLLGIVLTQSA